MTDMDQPVNEMQSVRGFTLQPQQRVLSTLNQDGSRRWLRPRLSRGRFLHWRRGVAYVLIAIFTLLPHLTINGKPALLLDLVRRRFTVLGYTFLPTDTVLLALLMVGVLVTILLLTALMGRIWCGWACPQTVYLEFVYRPIERLLEGTAGRGGAPRGAAAGWRRVIKYAIFLLVSMFLAHTFLAYFVGVEALSKWVRQSPLEHPGPFGVMVAVTGLMLFDFSFFREQTCIIACPYGRLQSVLLDRRSWIISYDSRRGEPRGKKRSAAVVRELPVMPDVASDGAATPGGDCVDCRLCVTTCPTGIDIRDGLQLECIGCAQCIDACDAVMARIGRPRGLIRYSSQAAMAGLKRLRVRPRLFFYSAILIVVATAFGAIFATKRSADVVLLRGLGRPFVSLADGLISNPVRAKVTNRSARDATYRFRVAQNGVELRAEEPLVRIAAGETRTVGMHLVAQRGFFRDGPQDIIVQVRDDAEFEQRITWRMLGPRP